MIDLSHNNHNIFRTVYTTPKWAVPVIYVDVAFHRNQAPLKIVLLAPPRSQTQPAPAGLCRVGGLDVWNLEIGRVNKTSNISITSVFVDTLWTEINMAILDLFYRRVSILPTANSWTENPREHKRQTTYPLAHSSRKKDRRSVLDYFKCFSHGKANRLKDGRWYWDFGRDRYMEVCCYFHLVLGTC